MKSSKERQIEILRRIEKGEYSILFEQFYTHEIGGHEEARYPEWPDEQDRYEMDQLIQRGLVVKEFTKGDEPWLGFGAPGDPHKESYVTLTPKAHDLLASYGLKGWLRSQMAGLRSGIFTIAVAVLLALATNWAIHFLGAPKP
jgi:hypothetical protein